jgi:hypothetical protein
MHASTGAREIKWLFEMLNASGCEWKRWTVHAGPLGLSECLLSIRLARQHPGRSLGDKTDLAKRIHIF